MAVVVLLVAVEMVGELLAPFSHLLLLGLAHTGRIIAALLNRLACVSMGRGWAPLMPVRCECTLIRGLCHVACGAQVHVPAKQVSSGEQGSPVCLYLFPVALINLEGID